MADINSVRALQLVALDEADLVAGQPATSFVLASLAAVTQERDDAQQEVVALTAARAALQAKIAAALSAQDAADAADAAEDAARAAVRNMLTNG
jgi:BMFP domain-containing protein YqiC